MATRKKSSNAAFGFGSELSRSMIPTKADVIRHYFFIQKKEKIKSRGSATANDCYNQVAKDVQGIWDTFSFPVIQERSISSAVERLIRSALSLNKVPLGRRNEDFDKNVASYDVMFDICTCKCYDKGIERPFCRCEVKIPMVEWESFVGQKQRRNQLGSVDRVAAAVHRRSHSRARQEQERLQMAEAMEVVPSSSVDYFCEDREDSDNDVVEFVPDVELIEHHQNRYSYNHLPVVADRYRVSSRATAAIINAALKDMGILNESNMLDRKKIEREKNRVGKKNIVRSRCENVNIECIGFDGRKDDTLTKHGKVKEEHYVLIKDPGEKKSEPRI